MGAGSAALSEETRLHGYTVIVREGRILLSRISDQIPKVEVTIGDFAVISASFGKSAGDPGFDPMADIDRNDEVDIGDFALMSGNFGALGDD
jgi:hypothetical protein